MTERIGEYEGVITALRDFIQKYGMSVRACIQDEIDNAPEG